MSNNHTVQFKLFEKNGSIKISLQNVVKSCEKEDGLIEYYVASDPQNIEKILDTLVDTVKSISISGPDLYMNYRKNDTFVMANYNQLRRCPELDRFFKKVDRKLKHLEKKKKTKGRRKKVTKVRKGLGAAVVAGILLVSGLTYTIMDKTGFFEEDIPDDDNDKLNSELPKLLIEGTAVTTDLFLDPVDCRKKEPFEVEEKETFEEVVGVDAREELEEVAEVAMDSESTISSPDTKKSEEEIDAQVDAEIDALAQQLSSQNATDEEIRVAAEAALSDVQAVRNQTVVQTEASDGKVNYITLHNLTPNQIDTIKATIQHEAGFDEVEVYASASAVINRCKSGRWNGGSNPYKVIIAPGQFQSYYEGYYLQYTNGNYAEYTDQIVDALLTGELEPMHDYERFASGEHATGVQYTKNGNFYR